MIQTRKIERTPEGMAFIWIRKDLLGGVTQSEFARKIGVAPSYVSNIESGAARLSDSKIRIIAEKFSDDPDIERSILLRLQDAMMESRVPEQRAELEFKRLRWKASEGAPAPWAKWAEHIRGLTFTSDDYCEMLGESAAYVEGLLGGEIQPSRTDIQLIAEKTGTDPIRMQLLAGYLPTEAASLAPIVEDLISIELGDDERMKELVRSVLQQASTPAK